MDESERCLLHAITRVKGRMGWFKHCKVQHRRHITVVPILNLHLVVRCYLRVRLQALRHTAVRVLQAVGN